MRPKDFCYDHSVWGKHLKHLKSYRKTSFGKYDSGSEFLFNTHSICTDFVAQKQRRIWAHGEMPGINSSRFKNPVEGCGYPNHEKWIFWTWWFCVPFAADPRWKALCVFCLFLFLEKESYQHHNAGHRWCLTMLLVAKSLWHQPANVSCAASSRQGSHVHPVKEESDLLNHMHKK